MVLVAAMAALGGCGHSASTAGFQRLQPQLDVQGHRGCRGLLPENSIPAFVKAVDLGVSTLELDVVVTKDSQLVVSHDPFINPEFCNTGDTPLGDLSIYNLTYAQVAAYDCGSNGNPKFPDQQHMATHKPLLADVIDTIEKLMVGGKHHRVYYNIETKSKPETDDVMHPTPPVFSGMLYRLLKQKGVLPYVTIQSFDPRTLREMKKLDNTVPLVLLVENDKGYQANVDTLGFVPFAYSPNFMLVDSSTMKLAHLQKVQVIPWTVDDTTDMARLINLGVDGIITDRPDWAMDLVGKLKIPVK